MTSEIITDAESAATPESRSALESISSRSVVFELYISSPHWRRRMATSEVAPEEDAELIHVSKDLIDRKALLAITSGANEFKRWLVRRTLPCSLLRGGMHLVPAGLVLEVDERARLFITERARLVEDLVAKYAEVKADARVRLGVHYRELDYPMAATLVAAFAVRRNFLTLDIPRALEVLDRDLFEREKARVEAEWREAYGEIRDALRASFAGLVGHLADRLAMTPDGKRPILRDSAVSKLREFLDTFAARNLTGDEELADLAVKARNIITGVSGDDLRNLDLVRESVRQGMESVRKSVDGLVISPRRRLVAGGDNERA